MSTRSRIGMVLPSGKVGSIYCHSDGYLSGVGETLQKHYTDPVKIAALIALGDLSCLGEGVDDGDTVAYMRDRHETDCPMVVSDTEDEFRAIDSGQEYVYLWRGDKWHVWCTHTDSTIQGGELTPELVAEALEE